MNKKNVFLILVTVLVGIVFDVNSKVMNKASQGLSKYDIKAYFSEFNHAYGACNYSLQLASKKVKSKKVRAGLDDEIETCITRMLLSINLVITLFQSMSFNLLIPNFKLFKKLFKLLIFFSLSFSNLSL